MLGAIEFACASALVIVGACSAVSLLGLTGCLERLLAGFLFAAAQVQLSLLIAGLAVDALRPGWVLAINAALTLALAAAAYGRRPQTDQRAAWSAGRLRSALRDSARRILAAIGEHPLPSLLVALVVLGLSWRLLIAYALPPYGYDALSYHLPTVISWISEHRIVVSDAAGIRGYFPPAGELLFSWPVLFLRDLAFTGVVQIAFAGAGALAVSGIARDAGFERPSSWVAGALFALTPIVLAQANTAYVDVISASSLLIALYFIHRCAISAPSWRLLAPAGIAAALVAGSKPNGLLLGGVLLIVLAGYLAWEARRRRLGSGGWKAPALAFVIPLLVLGSWAHARNWIEAGNPVWPAQVAPLGAEIFEGRAPAELIEDPPANLAEQGKLLAPVRSWAQDLTFWDRSSYLVDERLGGLGPLWAWLGIPLLLAFTVHTVRRNRLLLMLVLVPIGVTSLLGPYAWWSRFTIPLAAAAALAIAWYWQERAWSGFGRAGAIALGAVKALTVALAVAGLVIASLRVNPGIDEKIRSAGSILGYAAKLSGQPSYGRAFDPDLRWLQRLHDPSRIGFGGDVPLISPLAGPEIEHSLVRLPQDSHPAKLSEAIEELDYLFAVIGSPLERWAGEHPELLRVVSTGERMRAYRVQTSSQSVD